MHRVVAAPGPLVAASVAALLAVACSGAEEDVVAATEVAGVVLEREAGGDADDGQHAEAAPGRDVAEEAADGRPEGLLLLQSGPVSVGVVWVAAAGDLVALDGQTLEHDTEPSAAYLDAVVDVAAAGERLQGCELRLVAPEGAELHATGVMAADLVVDRDPDPPLRFGLSPAELDVVVAAGQDLTMPLMLEEPGELDAERDTQVRCEGRFDRT
jgi:hypothetical protein